MSDDGDGQVHDEDDGDDAQKNSRYFSMPPLVSPRKITSKEQAQRFHTYDLPLPSYGIVLLIR